MINIFAVFHCSTILTLLYKCLPSSVLHCFSLKVDQRKKTTFQTNLKKKQKQKNTAPVHLGRKNRTFHFELS